MDNSSVTAATVTDSSVTTGCTESVTTGSETNGSERHEEDDDDLTSITPGDIEFNMAEDRPEITPQEIDTMLSKHLAQLSIKERESITNDIYGILPEVEETPQLIQSKLDEMDRELDLLENVSAYEMATLQDADYVKNPPFRLRFLRTDLYDAKAAAWRFTQHFQVKLDLFGKDKLVKDITQDDLPEATLQALYNGFSQFLPLRDRAGRLVHCQFVIPPEVDLVTKLRMDFYMCMVKSEDETVQKKGCVGIRFYNGQWLQAQLKALPDAPSKFQNWQASKLLSVVPIRPSAMHLCHDSNSIWSPVFAVMKYVMAIVVRNRTREHYGTHEQCLFQLQTFGIATQNNCFPLNDEGQITTEFHSEAWNKRRNLERLRVERKRKQLELEAAAAAAAAAQAQNGQQAQVEATTNGNGAVVSSSSDNKNPATATTATTSAATTNATLLLPPEPEPFSIAGQHDVLLGRGKRYYEHLGNVRFRYWVSSRAQEYNATKSVTIKKQMTADVVNLVHQAGGRFLKDDNHAGWVEVDDETARLKVSHVFRNMRLKSNGKGGAANGNNKGGEKRNREE